MASAAWGIPIPPSVNNLFRNGRGRARVKTAAYRAWIEQASLLLRLQGLVRVQTPARVLLEIRSGQGFLTSRDLDNLLKPTLDLLVSLGVLPGDNASNVCEVTVRYRPGSGQAAAFVTVETVI